MFTMVNTKYLKQLESNQWDKLIELMLEKNGSTACKTSNPRPIKHGLN